MTQVNNCLYSFVKKSLCIVAIHIYVYERIFKIGFTFLKTILHLSLFQMNLQTNKIVIE